MDKFEQALMAAVEQGLPLVSEPYRALAEQLDCEEQLVIATLSRWQDEGLIRRFGLVVRHRKLGYTANAMVVWQIGPEQIDRIAMMLAAESAVTLCYQRPTVPSIWPYNLFCMIHGKNREAVHNTLEQICQKHQLQHINKDILFSTKAYKQQGARFARQPLPEAGNG